MVIKKNIPLTVVFSAVVLAALVLASLTPTTTVQAVVIDNTATPGPAQDDGGRAKLAGLYQREKALLSLQAGHLATLDSITVKLGNLIAALQAKGKDVAPLVEALDKFKADVASARSPHENAAWDLDVHLGFDGLGNVTDLEAARQTVAHAHANLLVAHNLIKRAVYDLRRAIDQWRSSP